MEVLTIQDWLNPTKKQFEVEKTYSSQPGSAAGTVKRINDGIYFNFGDYVHYTSDENGNAGGGNISHFYSDLIHVGINHHTVEINNCYRLKKL